MLIDSIRFDRDGDCWKIERTGIENPKAFDNLRALFLWLILSLSSSSSSSVKKITTKRNHEAASYRLWICANV